MAYQGDRAVTLPNMFPSPGQALQGVVAGRQRDRERQQEIDYRQERDRDTDDWRKMNLIQELTDLSQYKTGSAVADGLANRMMSGVFQKYTGAASNLSAAELQAGIQKDMQGIISGIGGLKSELDVADDQVKAIKQNFPDVDAAPLYDVYRKEIVDRHLNEGGSDFRGPMQIGQPRFNLSDPAFLSRFIKGNKNLREAVINPKGTDPTDVFVGSADQYTKFTGKLTPWMKPNYDPATVKGGFLPKGVADPQLELKSEEVPLPAGQNGQPFKVVTGEVYDLFRNDGKSYMEIIAGTRQMFPDYDNLPPESKQLAERKFLHDFIKSNDRSNFHPTDVKAAPRTNIRVSAGGSGGTKEVTINDVWSEIEEAAKGASVKPSKFGSEGPHTPVADLSPEAKEVILKYVRGWKGNNYITQEDIGVRFDGNNISVVDASTGKSWGTLNRKSVNIKVNTTQKDKDAVEKMGNPKTTTPKYKGLDAKGNPIFE
jgi:hypothetical protein